MFCIKKMGPYWVSRGKENDGVWWVASHAAGPAHAQTQPQKAASYTLCAFPCSKVQYAGKSPDLMVVWLPDCRSLAVWKFWCRKFGSEAEGETVAFIHCSEAGVYLSTWTKKTCTVHRQWREQGDSSGRLWCSPPLLEEAQQEETETHHPSGQTEQLGFLCS